MNFSIKKILLFTFILLELSAMCLMANIPDPVSTTEESTSTLIKPKIKLSFTIARRRDCEGFGICDLVFEVSLWRTNTCSGTLYVDDVNKNMFILEIDKATGISAEGYVKYFKSGIFLMEDDSPIPSEMLKELGISGSRTLLAGKHRITERNGLIYVSIPVK